MVSQAYKVTTDGSGLSTVCDSGADTCMMGNKFKVLQHKRAQFVDVGGYA